MSKMLEPINDIELNKLLDASTAPPELVDFEARLLRKMAALRPAVVPHDNVVPLFKPTPDIVAPKNKSRGLSIAAALAASLVVGVLIGNTGDVSSVVDGLTGAIVSGQVAEFAPAGVDDIGLADEGRNS